ncbi:MAG: hypothetical protein Tsb0013_16610 [Phycisphaerales bacterium]
MRDNEAARERVCAMPDDERERLWDEFVRERCSTQGDLAMRILAKRDPREFPVVARLFTAWIDAREERR